MRKEINYQRIFEDHGVNDTSVELCCKIARTKVNEFIDDRITEYTRGYTLGAGLKRIGVGYTTYNFNHGVPIASPELNTESSFAICYPRSHIDEIAQMPQMPPQEGLRNIPASERGFYAKMSEKRQRRQDYLFGLQKDWDREIKLSAPKYQPLPVLEKMRTGFSNWDREWKSYVKTNPNFTLKDILNWNRDRHPYTFELLDRE